MPGDTVKVRGERGSFIVLRIAKDGSLTCWGGTENHKAFRDFRPERCRKIRAKRR